MYRLYLALGLVGLVAAGGVPFETIDYEFEDVTPMIGREDWVWRSNASNSKALRLTSDGPHYIVLTLCASPSGSGGNLMFFVSNIRFSNDGNPDTITVSLNNQWQGAFTTRGIWNNGQQWNVFEDSAQIGGQMIIPEGQSKLYIAAETGPQGVELDKITFRVSGQDSKQVFVCGGHFIVS